MDSTEEEIVPRRTRECLGEKASSQSTQEPLSSTPAVRHRRGGSRSRHRLIVRLARELATVTANMRAIFQQNVAMQELLGHMQYQLASSSHNNEEVLPSKRERDMDMVAKYATRQITGETVILSGYSRTITPRRSACVFDKLGPLRNKRSRPHILPTQVRLLLSP